MQTELSMTITPAEPSIDLRAARPSKSICAPAISSAFMTGTDDPPGITAFSGLAGSFIPPQ